MHKTAGPGAGAKAAAASISLKAGRFRLDREELLRSRRGYRRAQRVQDVVLSLLGLTVLAAPMLILAVVIWVDSPGASPIFVQNRVGLNGTMFRMYKFRSMIPRAEEGLGALLGQNEMAGPVFKMKGDPRITRVGRLLRRTGLDELPQLVNVLKGDMSLVGPRPALPREAAAYSAYQQQRFYVLPGLTCYWQVQPCRNQMAFDEWIDLDLQHIQDRSFWLDWKLMIQTIPAVLGMYGE